MAGSTKIMWLGRCCMFPRTTEKHPRQSRRGTWALDLGVLVMGAAGLRAVYGWYPSRWGGCHEVGPGKMGTHASTHATIGSKQHRLLLVRWYWARHCCCRFPRVDVDLYTTRRRSQGVVVVAPASAFPVPLPAVDASPIGGRLRPLHPASIDSSPVLRSDNTCLCCAALRCESAATCSMANLRWRASHALAADRLPVLCCSADPFARRAYEPYL